MDAFETLVGMLLELEGFWIKSGFKVELTKEEKVAIGRPSSPRWELDLVAYKGSANELRVVECKSYLDSHDVTYKSFQADEAFSDRYKLFNDSNLREVIVRRLVAQMEAMGACAPSPRVVLCLAAGKVAGDVDRASIKKYFKEQGWLLLDETWLRDTLASVADGGYTNNGAAIVAKLLLRK